MEGSESGSCMLVMPKTSDHGWWDNMVGTTETAVAAEVSRPVLLCRKVEFKGITRIRYLADAQSLSDGSYKGFRFLKTLAEMHSAQVVVGFIFDLENSGLN
ncbi:MAG: hypothetical protein IPM82_31085 [Saprospiraceae bacterium]|nr:hypothetical protein [Saprospiraceae bacterium]